MNNSPSENPFQSPAAEHELVTPFDDAIVAEGTFTQRDLYGTYRTMLYNWRMIAVLIGISILLFSSTFSQFMGRYWMLGAAAAPLLGLVPFCALLELRFYYQSYWRLQYKQLGVEPEQQRISLDEQGVHFESQKMKASLPWTRFVRLCARRRMLVLVAQPFGWISLPSHFFESRDKFAAARQLILQRISQPNSPVTTKPPTADPLIDAVISGAIVAEGTLTRGEFYSTNWRLVRTNALLSLVMVTCFLSISLAYGYGFYAANRPHNLSMALMQLFAATLILIRWFRYFWSVRRTYRDLTQHTQVRWTITAKKLNALSNTFSLSLKWEEFDKVVVAGEMLLLRYLKTQAFSLPRRFFASDADWRQVVAWAQESRQTSRDN